MSFGDPHNPYGQQPPQGQPGYGYPQQAPQGIPPQGGYAYPQQAPQGYPGGPAGYPGGPGGYPGPHMEMPGGVKAARVILFILGGLQVLGTLLALVGGALFAAAFSDSGDSYGSSTDEAVALGGAVIFVIVAVGLAFSLWAILTAAKLGKGRGGVRVSGIVYGSLLALFSGLGLLVNLAAMGGSGTPVGGMILSTLLNGLMTGLGIWVIVGLAKAGDYFRRPQY
ncbi:MULTISPECIES: hypothetical protein [unclassified Streptomyces]|uniref:hypothetical protein n=1 Tax=unclassified Streptomyces TaxID=2593676 RepID=UPI0004AB0625|nr:MULTISPECIES: hypothetical protein [unclassified Streptomyces]APU41788.1 hypothetical protein BSL84_20480 [Streptomyces sp. TN58]KJK47063.1 hypothetical protein UK14_21650 [Streptomyces sp. NRRL F-4428]